MWLNIGPSNKEKTNRNKRHYYVYAIVFRLNQFYFRNFERYIKFTDRSGNGGGWSIPPPHPCNQNSFFLEKKKMRNVYKRKNMYFDEKLRNMFFWAYFYVLDYSGYFDMPIGKLQKKIRNFFLQKISSIVQH